MKRSLLLAGTAVLCLLVGLLILLRLQLTPAKAPRLFVPGQFKTLRESPGHVAHIRGGKVTCSECHDLNQHGFQVPDLTLCARCHPDQVSTIHVGSPLAASAVDCQSCHNFGGYRYISPHNCIRCHSQRQGLVQPIVTHADVTCDQCHRPHATPSLVPRDCEECHADQAGVRHGGKAAGAQTCLDCHSVHDRERDADTRCQTCHTGAIPKTAVFADGHEKCVTCHAPHDFTRAGVRGCQTCHDDHEALAANTVRKHSACSNCHDPHAVGRERAADQCQRCHAKLSPRHPPDKDDRHRACLGCHPAHNFEQVVGKAVACLTCHTEASTPTSFHSEKTQCQDCHNAHSFALDVKDANLCGRCHAEQRRLTARARNGGHAKCIECHQMAAHAPKTAAKPCASCHGDVKASAPEGHSKCGDCHITHSGARRPEAQCQHCHEAQRTGMHASGVTGGCVTCHRPHGPKGPSKPPECTSCHVPARLPSLHHVAQHQSCANCHTPHERQPHADRKSCTAGECHTAIKDKPARLHEPDAKLCSGCHVFRH